MSRQYRILLFVSVWLLAPRELFAQVESGPPSGAALESLKAYAVTGDGAGQVVNYTAQRKHRPTLYVFIQADKWDRPVARFLRALDRGIADRGDAQVIAVWLTRDVEKSKEYLSQVQNSVQFQKTDLAVYQGDTSGPPGWGINTDAFVTAVVAGDGKTIASFGYRSVNETTAPGVLSRLPPLLVGD